MAFRVRYDELVRKHKQEELEWLRHYVKKLSDSLPKGQHEVLTKNILQEPICMIDSVDKLLKAGDLIERSLKKIDPLLLKAAEAIVQENLPG